MKWTDARPRAGFVCNSCDGCECPACSRKTRPKAAVGPELSCYACIYPSNDNTIVTTTAAIRMRSFQEEAFGSDCEVASFIGTAPENYIGTTSD